ncbi:putative LNK family protein [Dioscorea sansibarensis]
MDWYFTRETDDFVVPDGQETEEISTENLSRKSTTETVQQFNYDEQTLYAQITDEISGHRSKKSSNSSAYKQTSSINCSVVMSEASIQSISDFRLPNIIRNSLLEDDLRNSFLAYVNMDSLSLIADPARSVSSTCVKPFSFLQSSNYLLEDRIKENSSSSSLIPDESKISEGSPMFQNGMVNSESDAIADVDEPKCVEHTMLQELEHVMIQLNNETRICFRDALNRLAENSKRAEHRNRNEELNCENSRKGTNGTVAKLNMIDRMVANMMFSNPFFNLHNFLTEMTNEISSKEASDHQTSMHLHASSYQGNNETHLMDVLTSENSENMDEYFSDEISDVYPIHF